MGFFLFCRWIERSVHNAAYWGINKLKLYYCKAETELNEACDPTKPWRV